MKITTHKHIESCELDELVQKTYGRPYCFQQQDGCQSRGMRHVTVPESSPYDYEATEIPEEVNGYKRGVSFEAWLCRDPEAPVGDKRDDFSIELFWERNFYPSIDMVLNNLHHRGLLEAGEYVIVIDW